MMIRIAAMFLGALLFSKGALTAIAQPVGIAQRFPNTTLTLPLESPAFGFNTVNAFGDLLFNEPLCLRTPPGETNRIFVLEKGGSIRVVSDLDSPVPTSSLYLDLSSGLDSNFENGLLGLAFHPGFATNGQFYVYRSVRLEDDFGISTRQRLSRFTAWPPDAASASAATEVILFEQNDPAPNHNGGDLHFGPDGCLYVSLGDGGSQADELNNSQTLRKGFHAGILRIDVDLRPGSLPPNPAAPDSGLLISTNYAVPPDNPWVSAPFIHETNRLAELEGNVRTEFWAVGLRNPWRISFDPLTGQLWCGDVGQDAREEVNLIVAGGNYGWGFREGSLDASFLKAQQTNDWYNENTPAPYATNFTSLPPVFEYDHGSAGTNVGNSITGGLVYRGTRLSQLLGWYLFADYTPPGNIWALRYEEGAVSGFQQLMQDPGIVAFGTDPRNGDVLMADISEGMIKRLIYDTNSASGTALAPTLADTGAFSDLLTLTPHAGIVAYDINLPFWSDNALKKRWFSLPDASQTLSWSARNNWSFPVGTVWIKHFELVTNEITQARRRLETRFLVRSSNGVYGLTYRWPPGDTNAYLVAEEGLSETVPIVPAAGSPVTNQTWLYPSRSACVTCHNRAGGYALSFNSAQLNCTQTFTNFPGATGATDNLLRSLEAAGYLDRPLTNRHLLPALAAATNSAVSLEWRVRSYFAANCAFCHQPGSLGLGGFDLRLDTPTAWAGLIQGGLLKDFGHASARVIVPGSIGDSMLYQRVAGLAGSRMPPLGTTVIDSNNLALLAGWITNGLLAQPTFPQWQAACFGSPLPTAGRPEADPDADGISNLAEFLAGSNPLQPGQPGGWLLSNAGPGVTLSFPIPANRSAELKVADTLASPVVWKSLDVPANRPFFASSNRLFQIEEPLTNAPARFYRIELRAP